MSGAVPNWHSAASMANPTKGPPIVTEYIHGRPDVFPNVTVFMGAKTHTDPVYRREPCLVICNGGSIIRYFTDGESPEQIHQEWLDKCCEEIQYRFVRDATNRAKDVIEMFKGMNP